jgi:thioesterase domain-containing protein/acyl carrier protein
MIEENNSRETLPLPRPAKDRPLLLKTAPPRSNLERALVRIWEQVLHRAPIGIHEDFFDLGGDSIQAALIFARIEESFHRRMPLTAILGSPTVERLAAALVPDKSWDRKAFVVPIQAGGEKPALFCVGGGTYWRAVSEHLGAGQPIFNIGLELEAAEDLSGRNSLEKLARHMVSALREKQPLGPYYLCGYCQDGIFAYEVARQLAIHGHEVGLLALIEARNPSPQFKVRAMNGLRRAAMRIAFQLDQFYQLIRTREVSRYFRTRKGEMKRFMLRLYSRISPGFRLRAHQSGRIDLQEFLYLEAGHFKPKPLACPTAIFRCTDWPILSGGDPFFGWRELLKSRLEIHAIPGIHEEIFREPNVQVLAGKLRACLRKATKEAAPDHDSAMDGA